MTNAVNALVLDHWAGRSIDDLAAECDRILADPSRQPSRQLIEDLVDAHQ